MAQSSYSEKPVLKSEMKMIDKITVLTPTQKRYLDERAALYKIYRDSRVDHTHLRFWRYMTTVVLAWLRRWVPPMWAVWRKKLKRYWKTVLQERIIRYYDWKLGGITGLRKLQRNKTPQTPCSSPVGKWPERSYSYSVFLESPVKLGSRGRFRPLFDD